MGLGLSVGLILVPLRTVDETEELFTPSSSQANRDRGQFLGMWPLDEDNFIPGKSLGAKILMEILCFSNRPDGNVLDEEVLTEIDRLNQFFLTNFTADGLGYSTACLRSGGSCFGNEQVRLVMGRRRLGAALGGRLYPTMGPESGPVYLGNLIGTPDLDHTGALVAARSLRLAYFFRQHPQLKRDPVAEAPAFAFLLAMQHYLEHNYSSPILKLHFAHSDSLNQGMMQTNERFAPNFAVSLGLLSLFSVVCNTALKQSSDGRIVGVDGVRSRPWHALGAVFSSALALGSSFGLLLLLGYHFNGIANIIVFLVLSIGLDDMFILVAAWEASQEKEVGRRLADSASHAIVSVTITSLTDAICFAIGCISSLQGVRIFCVYATLAVVFDYIFQLSLFLAIMSFLGQAEMDGRLALFPCFPRRKEKIKTVAWKGIRAWNKSPNDDPHPPPSSKPTPTQRPPPSALHRFFHGCYGPLLFHPAFRIVLVVLGLGYVGACVSGAFRLQEGLVPGNIVMADHHLAGYFNELEQEFFAQGFMLHVAVTTAPDLSTADGRSLIFQLAFEIENTPYTMGYNATVIWLRSFLAFLDELGAPIDETLWDAQVNNWVDTSPARAQWESDIRWYPPRPPVSYPIVAAFQFQTGMRNIETPYKQRQAVRLLRSIVEKERYASLGALVYNPLMPFVEQYEMVRPTTVTSLSLGLGCMTLVGLLLIPSSLGALLVTLSIVSIDAGVLGLMGWWGVRLDAVSMICLIMATGFAVDLSAHVTYAFLAAPESNSRLRALTALHNVGWPVLQGGLSTLLGTTVLASVDAYIVQTFFKTVFLVITLGLFHSLLVIPLLLSTLFPDREEKEKTHSLASTPSTVSSTAPS